MRYCFIYYIFAPIVILFSKPLHLNNVWQKGNPFIQGTRLLIDSSGQKSVDQLDLLKFTPHNYDYLENQDTDFAYWYEVEFKNMSDNEDWYLTSHNYAIQELDLYVMENVEGQIRIKKFPCDKCELIYNREIQHKQPVYKLHIPHNQTYKYYIRIKNHFAFKYYFDLATPHSFTKSSFDEYFRFGLFYGTLVFVTLYGILVFISVQKKSQLLYILFMISQIFFMLSRDGSIVFFVNSDTSYFMAIKNLTMAMFSVSLILFSIYFFKIKNTIGLKILYGIIMIRILSFLFLINTLDLRLYHLDMFILTLATFGTLNILAKKPKQVAYFTLGLFALWITYGIYYLSLFNWLQIGGFSFFALYFGIIIEALFFTIAQGNDVRWLLSYTVTQDIKNQELELLVTDRTKTIQKQSELLESRNKELNLFLYKSAHDIKGPLKTIEGLCNLYEMDPQQDPTEFLNKIMERSNKLESILGDLTILAKIRRHNLFLKKLQLDSFHKTINKDIAVEMANAQGEIIFEVSPHMIVTDVYLLKTIYINLLKNAIRFKHPDKHLKIKISIKTDHKFVYFAFKDNGIGIDPKYWGKIFDMFEKAHTISDHGNGLGLYICKTASERLNGSILVTSIPNQGSIFTLKIEIPKTTLTDEI